MGKIHVGDTGTKIMLDIDPDGSAGITEVDIDTASILATKPDGQTVEWQAQKAGHTIYYITQQGDIDMHGIWTLQAMVSLTSGWSGRGEKTKIMVYA